MKKEPENGVTLPQAKSRRWRRKGRIFQRLPVLCFLPTHWFQTLGIQNSKRLSCTSFKPIECLVLSYRSPEKLVQCFIKFFITKKKEISTLFHTYLLIDSRVYKLILEWRVVWNFQFSLCKYLNMGMVSFLTKIWSENESFFHWFANLW